MIRVRKTKVRNESKGVGVKVRKKNTQMREKNNL